MIHHLDKLKIVMRIACRNRIYLALLVLCSFFPSFPASADTLLVAQITYQGDPGAGTTITPPSGWTLIIRSNSGTGSTASNSAIYYKIATAGDFTTADYTFTLSPSRRFAAGIVAYSGVHATTPIGASGATAGSGSTISAPSVTTAVSDMIIRFYAQATGGATLSNPGAHTQRYSDFTSAGPNGSAGLAADRVATGTTSGAQTTTGNSTSANNVGQTVIIKPAVSETITFIASASTNSGGPTGGSVTITNPVFGMGGSINHIRLIHDGVALTCAPETVTIQACADTAIPCTQYTGSVTTTLSPTGWVGGDTISFSGGSTTAQLRRTTTGTVTLGAGSTSPTPTNATRCFIGVTETCSMEFFESGFIFDVPNHISDTIQNVTVSAVRTSDNSQTCAPAFTGTKDVKFWTAYSNPNTGTLQASVNGGSVPTSEPASPNTTLSFDANAQVTISVQYPDVGQLQLLMRLDGTGAETGLVMLGNDLFIARPDHFTLNIPGNPAAADANGGVFVRAGEDFEITVEARNASGDITPNFGRETVPESVDLTRTLVAPAGGNNPAVAGSFGTFGEDCAGDPAAGGTACGEFNWPEVGIITLTPELASGAYLGTGDVVGNVSANIGRFIPHHFSVTQNTPEFEAACDSFTYIGQRFEYSTPPVLTVTARSAADGVTQNYTAAFFKMTDAKFVSDGNKTYNAVTGTLDLNLISTPDPAITDNADGTATLTFNSGTGIAFVRDDPEPPFDAEISLEINVIDTDDVFYGDISNNNLNPVRIPETSTDYIGFDSDPEQRWGRLRMINAGGSELLPLTVPVVAEYADSTTTAGNESFVINTDDDNCAGLTLADFDFSGPLDGISTPTFTALTNGVGALDFSAPNVTGFIEAEAELDSGFSYLQYNWDGETPPVYSGGDVKNPRARATFGIFNSSRNTIYMREPW
jgi:MSHA biogenesis protein MshQ